MNEKMKQSNAPYVFIYDVNCKVTEKTEKMFAQIPQGQTGNKDSLLIIKLFNLISRH